MASGKIRASGEHNQRNAAGYDAVYRYLTEQVYPVAHGQEGAVQQRHYDDIQHDHQINAANVVLLHPLAYRSIFCFQCRHTGTPPNAAARISLSVAVFPENSAVIFPSATVIIRSQMPRISVNSEDTTITDAPFLAIS